MTKLNLALVMHHIFSKPNGDVRTAGEKLPELLLPDGGQKITDLLTALYKQTLKNNRCKRSACTTWNEV